LTDHNKISILMGLGALVLLVLLLRQKASGGSNGSSIPDEVVEAQPTYPQNPVPIDQSTIEVGGSPINLTYNYGAPLPTLSVGDNTGGECGCDTFCDAAGQKVTVQKVPADVLKTSAANFSSYQSKLKPTRVSFSQTPSGAMLAPMAGGGSLG
jgi:hypothetical protein